MHEAPDGLRLAHALIHQRLGLPPVPGPEGVQVRRLDQLPYSGIDHLHIDALLLVRKKLARTEKCTYLISTVLQIVKYEYNTTIFLQTQLLFGKFTS
jgi:hypothetical protein